MNVWMGVLLVLAAGSVGAQSVYKCKTPQGLVFSQSPCGDEAEKLAVAGSRQGSSEATAAASGPFIELTQEDRFSIGGSAAEVLERWGPPAARYNKGSEERWLYPNRGTVEDGTRQCAELHVDGDTVYQITYLPEPIMAKSLRVARSIGDWRPPSPPPRHSFYMISDHDPRGSSKAAMVARYGQPNLKKIFNGIEVWEYHGVQMAPDKPETLTLFVEFDGDRVSQTMGN